ncbi:Sec-independent protein translocase protein TatB [Serratia sp. M24T3]|uniref:Sec-independent protein translocase protein TatB n=1 Tax=Serratia sp. M24T3 TaxID=932213 RepID=UPI00025BBC8C|nr:Sec-independent protein translocase protein TatB [Serratia sp. M24T3]EIC82649.1 sec-independent translocase [Serratia sp. M24T3]
MFDIGFSELLLVFVIGLVVLGPERLPVAVRTVAGWIRTLRSMAASVQNELNQEFKLQELQDSLKKAEEAGLKNLSPEIKASIDDLKEAASSMKRSIHENLSPADQAIADATEGNTIHNPVLRDAEAHHDEGISPASAEHVAESPAVSPTAEHAASPAMAPSAEHTAQSTVIPAMEPTVTPVAQPMAKPASEPAAQPNVASAPASRPAPVVENQSAVKPAPSSQTTGER